jgi:protein-L-isoaspartate(D-aspartate) O-methyltransferase
MIELNVEVARHNMVNGQIRTWDVLDERLLDVIARGPRHEFVPTAWRHLAYADLQIPLGHGQVMMQPMVEARLLQALEIGPKDRILEIGTGSGWMTWLLAQLGREVVSVELVPELHQSAAARLAAHGVGNVTLELGDGARGWPNQAPYDVILVTGSLPLLPDSLREQLAPNGRLAAIVGRSPAMTAMLIRRRDSRFDEQALFTTDLPPLANAPQPERFVF